MAWNISWAASLSPEALRMAKALAKWYAVARSSNSLRLPNSSLENLELTQEDPFLHAIWLVDVGEPTHLKQENNKSMVHYTFLWQANLCGAFAPAHPGQTHIVNVPGQTSRCRSVYVVPNLLIICCFCLKRNLLDSSNSVISIDVAEISTLNSKIVCSKSPCTPGARQSCAWTAKRGSEGGRTALVPLPMSKHDAETVDPGEKKRWIRNKKLEN